MPHSEPVPLAFSTPRATETYAALHTQHSGLQFVRFYFVPATCEKREISKQALRVLGEVVHGPFPAPLHRTCSRLSPSFPLAALTVCPSSLPPALARSQRLFFLLPSPSASGIGSECRWCHFLLSLTPTIALILYRGERSPNWLRREWREQGEGSAFPLPRELALVKTCISLPLLSSRQVVYTRTPAAGVLGPAPDILRAARFLLSVNALSFMSARDSQSEALTVRAAS